MSEFLVSVDVEADGPIPGTYSMLSLGAVAIDHPDDTHYVELRPISDRFVPEALAVSGLDRDRLIREGVSARLAMRQFADWAVDAAKQYGERPVFCSFSTWDWGYAYWYLMTYVGHSPFGHSSLDMKSYFMGKYGTDWRGTGKVGMSKSHPWLLEGLPPHTHNSLQDAIEQAELFRRMRDGQAK